MRGGSPRTGVSLEARCARPREPVRARGARYALGADGADAGTAQNGQAARPPRVNAVRRRRKADAVRKRMSEGLMRMVGSFVEVVVVLVVWPGVRRAAECQAADVYQVPDTW